MPSKAPGKAVLEFARARLKYSCIDGISCDRDIGSDSSLGPTLMLYAF